MACLIYLLFGSFAFSISNSYIYACHLGYVTTGSGSNNPYPQGCLNRRIELCNSFPCYRRKLRTRYSALCGIRGGSDKDGLVAEEEDHGTVAINLRSVLNRISETSLSLQRNPPRLVAVSKFQSDESIMEAYNEGQVRTS